VNKTRWGDILIGLLVAIMWVAATVYLFKHPSDISFGTWGTICGTMLCAYKWIDMRDDKEKDA
jgi:hypothetical protein